MGIKAWHIIVFSAVPLCLVFLGVLTGAVRGVGSSEQVFAPRPTPSPEGPRPTPEPGQPVETVIEIAAKDIKFSSRTMSAAAGSAVTIVFDNQDSGVLHNISIYESSQARNIVFYGELFVGPEKREYKFTAPAAGSYFFRCDVHPDQMTGTFSVQ